MSGSLLRSITPGSLRAVADRMMREPMNSGRSAAIDDLHRLAGWLDRREPNR